MRDTTRGRRRPEAGPAAAILCLGMLCLAGLAGTLACGGGEEDLGVPSGDTPAATEPDLEPRPRPGEPEESDLPADIPPAVGEADDPPVAATGPRSPEPNAAPSDASSATGTGTDDDSGRPYVTAFSGATDRGQYLTEQVAMCVQCHSPKDEQGRVIPERKFQGSPIPVESPYRRQDWAVEAPALAGMAFYTRDEAIRLLTQGIARDGAPPKPPMPPFRMDERDAAAVYDYLASLPRAP